jgi:hypothetical protein
LHSGRGLAATFLAAAFLAAGRGLAASIGGGGAALLGCGGFDAPGATDCIGGTISGGVS